MSICFNLSCKFGGFRECFLFWTCKCIIVTTINVYLITYCFITVIATNTIMYCTHEINKLSHNLTWVLKKISIQQSCPKRILLVSGQRKGSEAGAGEGRRGSPRWEGRGCFVGVYFGVLGGGETCKKQQDLGLLRVLFWLSSWINHYYRSL